MNIKKICDLLFEYCMFVFMSLFAILMTVLLFLVVYFICTGRLTQLLVV